MAPRPRGPVVARAPGRVNLIGDHTDYCGGLAMPMAIDRWTEVIFRPEPGTRRLVLTTDLGGSEAAGVETGTPSWARLAGAVADLAAPATGGRAEVHSTVPVGAGLSSSAAFSVALALALGASEEPISLARLCQQAEAAAGSDVGLLDPLAVAGARAGHAILIDFADLVWRHVPVPEGAEVVLVHSGVNRRLAGSPYRARRAECEAAAARLGGSLGAAREADVERLADPALRARARHVVTECRRVREVAAALADGDLRAAGSAMTESHRSLAGDFASSTPEVDDLVAVLVTRPGVHGARMTGGGFGGCVVALTEPGAVDPAHWPGRCWVVRPVGPATRSVAVR